MESDAAVVAAERQLVQAAATVLGIPLSEPQIDQLFHFRAVLLDWNTRMNLTAITEPHAVLTRHIIDTLTCLSVCDLPQRDKQLRLVDIGSGAGIPGLVLAIVKPEWQIASLEATLKKVRFQEAVIAELGLTNATVTNGRAEMLANDGAWRGQFAVVTARALAAMPTLLEWCQPFAAVGGMIIAPKKGDIGPELAQGSRAAHILGGGPIEALPLPAALAALVPDLADGRVIARVRQRKPTLPRYPRAGAAPVKTPLGGEE